MRAFAYFLLAASTSAYAYEVDTHGRMTQTAFERSALKTDGGLLERLGFDRLDANLPLRSTVQNPIGCIPDGAPFYHDAYVDAEGEWQEQAFDVDVRFRCPNNYEKRLMLPTYSGRIASPPTQGDTPELRIEAWLMRGAIREDDLVIGNYYDLLDAPDSSPWGEINRPTHHFYSPVTNTSDSLLTQSALPWALGQSDPFAAIPAADPARENHFSYADAISNYYRALVFKREMAVTEIHSRIDAIARMAFWAGALKSLGHTLHLLQDMAQPQHVRGEAHNYLCRGALSLGNADIEIRTYENFSNFRVTDSYNLDVFQAGGTDTYIATNGCEETAWRDLFARAGFPTAPPIAPFTSTVYPIPAFPLARRFFTTRAGNDPTTPGGLGAAVNSRFGMADYTNRGFYTQGAGFGVYLSPPPPSELTQGDAAVVNVPGLGNLRLRALYWQVPDPVAPTFVDSGLDPQGRAPIASVSYWSYSGIAVSSPVLTLANYTQMADMLAPRAIAYSTGLINFFFRGKLEIEPIDQRIFALINQGEPHTINADGYPIRTSNNKIFGFEKIRLKVRNLTDPIIESGTNLNVPQRVGVGTLVAVARYHRNACYKADLTGERQYRYSPPPTLLVDEPICAPNLPTRTTYQEISVSAEIDILSDADLPGGSGGAPPASVEKLFDFSADPIPVNATDLFIQVVYRGRLGDEVDGIAVGTYDLREPTFYAGWNNTDYAYNETTASWQNAGGAFPARVMQGIRICAGFPSKWVYQYNISDPQPGLGFPITGTTGPGVLRLAFLFGKPTLPNQRVSFRSYPIMSVAPSAQVRLGNTAGQSRQASMEVYSASGANALPLPSNCAISPPAVGSNVWCFDPVLKRRGLAFGDMAHPLYYSTGVGNDGPDVDAPPTQIPFVAQIIRTGGTIRFDDETLANCPAGPALLSPELQRWIELREAAWDLGIDPDAPTN